MDIKMSRLFMKPRCSVKYVLLRPLLVAVLCFSIAAAIDDGGAGESKVGASQVTKFDGLTPEKVVPAGYNRAIPPNLALGREGPTNVTINTSVYTMDSISEKTMSFTCTIFVDSTWEDPRLNFPPNLTSDSRGLLSLPLEWLDHIWYPEPVIINAKKIEWSEGAMPEKFLNLLQGNMLNYWVKILATIACPLDLRNFPHDVQTCKIRILYIHSKAEDVHMTWDPKYCVGIGKDATEALANYVLTNYSGEVCDSRKTIGTVDPWSCLEGHYVFHRRLGHFIFNEYVPTVIIVSVSWYSFWLKPEKTLERISLGVTTLLTIYSQRVILSGSLPEVSYLKAIDIFNLVSTFFVFLSILQFAVVSVITKDFKRTDKKDLKAQKDPLSVTLEEGFRTYFDQKEEERRRERMKKYNWALTVDRVSRAAVPLSYITLNIAYWWYFYVPTPEEAGLNSDYRRCVQSLEESLGGKNNATEQVAPSAVDSGEF